LYGSSYFSGKFGGDRHTCSIVNLLVALQKMQNDIILGCCDKVSVELVFINVWALTIRGCYYYQGLLLFSAYGMRPMGALFESPTIMGIVGSRCSSLLSLDY
jgi:hypothetical protein